MKPFLALLLLFSFTARMSLANEGPNFAVQALDPKKEKFQDKAVKEGWTWKWAHPKKGQQFYTGWVKQGPPTPTGPKEKKFLTDETPIPKGVSLRDRFELAAVKDQGQCGSCVYFAVSATLEDMFRLRSQTLPTTAPQYLMDCAAPEWRCNGSYFEKVAGGLLEVGGAAKETDYPYQGRNQTCQSSPALIGKPKSFTLINNAPKSIMSAINKSYPVASTIGAGGPFMNYDSGVFNACSATPTNHQIEIIGYDCETSVDQAGNCKFNANGTLPDGVGNWLIKNSWGTQWGDQGFIRMKITSSGGQLCNNVAEEVGIIEVGLDPVPPKPPDPPIPPDPPVPPTPPLPPAPVGFPLWLVITLGAAAIIATLVAIFRK